MSALNVCTYEQSEIDSICYMYTYMHVTDTDTQLHSDICTHTSRIVKDTMNVRRVENRGVGVKRG